MLSEEVIEAVLAEDMWAEPFVDVLSLNPDITCREAYELQFETMRRRELAGDRIIGYKAAGTSLASQQLLESSGLTSPVVGTLLASNLAAPGGSYTIRPGVTYVEAEIAAVLTHSLCGPRISHLDAALAVGWLCPAIEIAPWSIPVVENQRSEQHAIATSKTTGLVVIGAPRPIDELPHLEMEAARLEFDGMTVGSGTGVEAMGGPLHVVAAVARRLDEFDRGLEPGMVIMTGSLLRPQELPSGTKSAHAVFSRLGPVAFGFHDQDALL